MTSRPPIEQVNESGGKTTPGTESKSKPTSAKRSRKSVNSAPGRKSTTAGGISKRDTLKSPAAVMAQQSTGKMASIKPAEDDAIPANIPEGEADPFTL